MKTTVMLIIMSLIQGIGFAQMVTADLVPIKKGEEPKAVLNTLKKDFPQATPSEFNFISSLLYGQKWSEMVSGDVPDNMQLVEVKVKEKKGNYEILFDKNGKVLKIKDFVKNADLPLAITKDIKQMYPAYKLVNDSEKIRAGKDEKAYAVYRVEIQNPAKGQKRNLFFDNSGKLLRERS
jgi:hypothetical protein